MKAINYASEPVKTFAKVVHDSNGNGNNRGVWDIINNNKRVTADDLKAVAEHTDKDKGKDMFDDCFFGTSPIWDEKYGKGDGAYRTVLSTHRYMNCAKKPRGDLHCFEPLSNFQWYLKHIPYDLLDDCLVTRNIVMPKLMANDPTSIARGLYDTPLVIYALRKTGELLYEEEYQKGVLLDNLLKDENLLNFLISPLAYIKTSRSIDRYSLKHDKHGYSRCLVQLGTRLETGIHAVFAQNETSKSTYSNRDYVSNTMFEQIIDSLQRMKILCTMMFQQTQKSRTVINPIYDCSDYWDYLAIGTSSNSRITRYRRTRNADKMRADYFSQTLALEALLEMGLGIIPNEDFRNKNLYRRFANNKLNRRIRTSYQSFVKAKTVEDRRKMRSLYKEQMNIIISDFMYNKFKVVELDCVEEQDKLFEETFGKPLVDLAKKNKKATRDANEKLSINDLAQVKTVSAKE